MRCGLALFASVALAGCLDVSSADDAGGDGGAGAVSAEAGAPSVHGSGCARTPSGVELCAAVSSCPQAVVDTTALPGCGYRVSGASALDLECDCSGVLCSFGAAQTCAEAAQLIESETYFAVCEQSSEGRCFAVPVDAGSSVPTTSGTCNTQCRAQCAGNPDCYQLCGC